MARVAIIGRSYLDSPTLKRLPPKAYDYLPRLWLVSDPFGCFEFKPRKLFGDAFPDADYWKRRVSEKDVASWLKAYEKEAILEVWEEGGRRFGFWLAWWEFNRHRPDYARLTPVPPSLKGSEYDPESRKSRRAKRLGRKEIDSRAGTARKPRRIRAETAPKQRSPSSFLLLPSSLLPPPLQNDDDDEERGIFLVSASPREQELEALTEFEEIVKLVHGNGSPWKATSPNRKFIRELTDKGLPLDEIAGAFMMYAEEMRDPAKISIKEFAGRFSKYHAALARRLKKGAKR